jgi:hypothetical protein
MASPLTSGSELSGRFLDQLTFAYTARSVGAIERYGRAREYLGGGRWYSGHLMWTSNEEAERGITEHPLEVPSTK